MHWITALERLRASNTPAVVLTVTQVRGHAPRRSGAKMVVAAGGTWGSIGGGNVEATAVERARELLAAGINGSTPCEFLEARLSDKARNTFGRQCCGGEVHVLIEPVASIPGVAVFGIGHVGLELARILARLDIELHLTDSREVMLTDERLGVLDDALARVHVHHAVVPEAVLADLPAGSHVLILTHDHAEDFALLDAALRDGRPGSIGLIGSSAKWTRFQKLLSDAGHSREAIAQVICPIGIDGVNSKEPPAIAVAVAAQILRMLTAAPAQ